MAVLILRKGCTLPRYARTSLMQAVRNSYGIVIGRRRVADPVGQGDSRDGAGNRAQVHPEGDAVYDAPGHGRGLIFSTSQGRVAVLLVLVTGEPVAGSSHTLDATPMSSVLALDDSHVQPSLPLPPRDDRR